MSTSPKPENEKGPPLTELPWYQRLNLLNTTLLIFLLAVIFSGSQIEGTNVISTF